MFALNVTDQGSLIVSLLLSFAIMQNKLKGCSLLATYWFTRLKVLRLFRSVIYHNFQLFSPPLIFTHKIVIFAIKQIFPPLNPSGFLLCMACCPYDDFSIEMHTSKMSLDERVQKTADEGTMCSFSVIAYDLRSALEENCKWLPRHRVRPP